MSEFPNIENLPSWKWLVDAPDGTQCVLEMSIGGEYFDPERVLWREDVDGPMPPIVLGSMVRVDDTLIEEPTRLIDHNNVVNSAARDHQWTAIKAERDRREEAGVKVGDYWFHTDPKSQTKVLGLVIAQENLPANQTWKTMSGVFVPMTPALAVQVYQSIMGLISSVFIAAEVHRAGMMVSPDPASYDFTGGWPQSYEESLV